MTALKKNTPVISFDLDFTLINNKEGIVNSFNHALRINGIEELPDENIVKMIGIPLKEMFERTSDFDPFTLSSSFRDYYGKKGLFQVTLIPGVKEMLYHLKDNDFKLGIVTSKKQEMAERLIENLRLNSLFEYIIGESDKTRNKRDPNLKSTLLTLYPENQFVVVGDHPKDRMLAELLNCPFVGVLTGNHSKEELESKISIKHVIIKSAAEISINLLMNLLD